MSRFYIENKGEWDHSNRKWAVEPYWLIHDGVKSVGPTRIDDPYIGEVLDGLSRAIKGTEAECDVWVNETEKRDAQIASLTGENERLRALVKEAQIEGWLAADSYGISDYEYQQIWEKSRARAALQPKEGEG